MLHKQILWTPPYPEQTQMAQFLQRVNTNNQLKLSSYEEFHNWSVRHVSEFWNQFWDYSNIIHSAPYHQVVDDEKKMPGAKWFPGSKLNYAENLLKYRDNRPAIHFKGEGQPTQTYSYSDLYNEVEQLAHSLRELGVKKGDRVAGFIPNMPQAIIAMLATASIGAIWSSSSPDFGIKGVLDRFTQIEPKVIFAANGYYYNGKSFDSLDKLSNILKSLPSIEKVIIVGYSENKPQVSHIDNAVHYSEFLSTSPEPLIFEQLPFDHPLYIMYSSGTTGLPKSIVHSAGGTLIQHLKELRLHCDLSREDTIFYYTTCGWMMWNWLAAGLAAQATLILYDGSPFYPDGQRLFDLVDAHQITLLGVSAKFIDSVNSAELRPITAHRLESLRTVCSTGSPLSAEGFRHVYTDWKPDLHVASISGGTDLCGCLVGGNPAAPVFAGQIQGAVLGQDMAVVDQEGHSVAPGQQGELVCRSPFPTMPLGFWDDPENLRYHETYFARFPGYWHQGDFAEQTPQGGFIIHGRSDATLNPGGVRMGTAEIYRIVEAFTEVTESLVIGQQWEGDVRVVLFVVTANQAALDDDLIQRLRTAVRTGASPRHVPAIVISVPDLPRTRSGKLVELAVRNVVENRPVTNAQALANPEALAHFQNLPALQPHPPRV